MLMSSDFNQFVELENGKPVIDMEEAYIMYVALTRAREKLILSPACVEAISASAATKAGRAKKQDSRGAEDTVELHRSRFHRSSTESSNCLSASCPWALSWTNESSPVAVRSPLLGNAWRRCALGMPPLVGIRCTPWPRAIASVDLAGLV
jgi:ATP-dependent exoDNAse (exonuclease V) beta subunit